MKLDRFFKQFNWRFLVVRIVVNALALAITARTSIHRSADARCTGFCLQLAA